MSWNNACYLFRMLMLMMCVQADRPAVRCRRVLLRGSSTTRCRNRSTCYRCWLHRHLHRHQLAPPRDLYRPSLTRRLQTTVSLDRSRRCSELSSRATERVMPAPLRNSSSSSVIVSSCTANKPPPPLSLNARAALALTPESTPGQPACAVLTAMTLRQSTSALREDLCRRQGSPPLHYRGRDARRRSRRVDPATWCYLATSLPPTVPRRWRLVLGVPLSVCGVRTTSSTTPMNAATMTWRANERCQPCRRHCPVARHHAPQPSAAPLTSVGESAATSTAGLVDEPTATLSPSVQETLRVLPLLRTSTSVSRLHMEVHVLSIFALFLYSFHY